MVVAVGRVSWLAPDQLCSVLVHDRILGILAHALHFESLSRLDSFFVRFVDISRPAELVEQHVEIAELEGLILAHLGGRIPLACSLQLRRAVVLALEFLLLGYVARQLGALLGLRLVRRRGLRLMRVHQHGLLLVLCVGAHLLPHEGRSSDSSALHQ